MAGYGEALGIRRVVAWLTSTSECPVNFAYVDSGRISAAAAPLLGTILKVDSYQIPILLILSDMLHSSL